MIDTEILRAKLKGLKRIGDKFSEARVLMASKSFENFVKTYFKHVVKTPETSYFRREFYKNEEKLLLKNRNLLIKAYRGAAKTTLISRLYVLFETIAKNKKHNIIIISSTKDMGKKTIDFLKDELEKNELLIKDFNIIKGDKWCEDEFIFYANKIGYKISAYGSGTKIRGENWRGFRPDLIICDDLENDENVKTRAQRDKMSEWFDKAIMKLPSRDDRAYNLIVIGTTLHYDSLLARLSNRLDFKTLNFPLVRSFPSLIDGDKWNMGEFVLDDSALNKEQYKNEYLSAKASFMSEYQNEPLSKDEASFNSYETFEIMPLCDAYYMGIDPALGKAKGDYFAVAILGYLGGKFYASVKMYKIKPEIMIDKILTFSIDILRLNRPLKIAIETVQFQEFFKDTLEKRARELGIYLPITALKNSVAKELRIDSLTPPINNAQILIDKNSLVFIDELDTYPKSAHDDGLDALEMAWRIAKVPNFDYEKATKILKERKAKLDILDKLLLK